MTLRARNLAVVAALASLALLVASSFPEESAAGKRGCKRWGKSSPTSLSHREARRAITCLVNVRRARAGLPPLDRSRRLRRAAQRHTRRMDGTGCFSHRCSGESALDRRLKNVRYLRGGLSSWAYGENIAWGAGGQGTPSAIVDAWMRSPGHRANILSRSFRDIGIGFVSGTPSSKRASGGVYTTDFGRAVG